MQIGQHLHMFLLSQNLFGFLFCHSYVKLFKFARGWRKPHLWLSPFKSYSTLIERLQFCFCNFYSIFWWYHFIFSVKLNTRFASPACKLEGLPFCHRFEKNKTRTTSKVSFGKSCTELTNGHGQRSLVMDIAINFSLLES